MLLMFRWWNIEGVDLGSIFTCIYTSLDKVISNRRNLTPLKKGFRSDA